MEEGQIPDIEERSAGAGAVGAEDASALSAMLEWVSAEVRDAFDRHACTHVAAFKEGESGATVKVVADGGVRVRFPEVLWEEHSQVLVLPQGHSRGGRGRLGGTGAGRQGGRLGGGEVV